MNGPNFSSTSSERLVHFYESVEADRIQEQKFMSSSAIREYAEALHREIVRRGLPHSPIIWPTDR